MRLAIGSLDLHDATLVSISFDWASGAGRIDLRLSNASIARLTAAGTRGFAIQRFLPWGPSVSINSARLAVGTDGRWVRLFVEMQSGDEITVEADQFDLAIDQAP